VPTVITSETATVFRAGRRRYFTKKAALRAYASARFRQKHPCECESPDYSSGYPGYDCESCKVRDKVMTRYLRVLKRIEQFGLARG